MVAWHDICDNPGLGLKCELINHIFYRRTRQLVDHGLDKDPIKYFSGLTQTLEKHCSRTSQSMKNSLASVFEKHEPVRLVYQILLLIVAVNRMHFCKWLTWKQLNKNGKCFCKTNFLYPLCSPFQKSHLNVKCDFSESNANFIYITYFHI